MPFTLLHPGLFAFGIACVSIPIILHLLKRKRRPIPWGAMRFLEQAYRKRRRILTIEQLILLALRCLLLMLLAMGVGSLMLGSGLAKPMPTTMVIVIDQSIGAALDEGGTTSLEKNKRFALRALNDLDATKGDRAALIGLAAGATGMVIPESSDIDAVKALIEQLEPTDSSLDLPGALLLAGEIGFDDDQPTRRVLVMAASGRGLKRSQSKASSLAGFDHVLMALMENEQIENIGIANATMTRSLVTHTGARLPMAIRIELVRSGIQGTHETTSTVRVYRQELSTRGEMIGEGVVRWESGQESMTAIVAIDPSSITAIAARTAILKIVIDDDANTRDNTRLISVATRSRIRVGIIHRQHRPSVDAASISAARWVRAALSPGDDESMGVSIVDVDPERASAMLDANMDALIILTPRLLDESAWDRISVLNESGLLVLVTPDANSGSLDWLDHIETMANGFIERRPELHIHEPPIGFATTPKSNNQRLLAGLDSEFDLLARAVSVSRSLSFKNDDSKSANPVATLANGTAFALHSSGDNGRGVVVVFGCAFDLEWTNLMARPMFVAILNEIVRQGVGIGSSMPAINAGTRAEHAPWIITSQWLAFDNDSMPTRLSNTSADFISHAGVIAQLDSQGTTRGLMVITPDANGAITDFVSTDELAERLLARVDVAQIDWIDQSQQIESDDDSPAMLASSTPGVSIALWMLMLAGIVAMIELILARLFTARLFDSHINGAGA